MSGLLQLVGLVGLAFVASAALGRNRRGFGTSAAWILAGLLIGPSGLAILDDDSAGLVRPGLSLCITWLAFVYGVRLRTSGTLQLSGREVLSVLLESGGVLGFVAGGLWLLGPRLGVAFSPVACLAIGIVSAASSRATVRFARARWRATGPASGFLETITGADDLIPLVGLLVLTACAPQVSVPSLLAARPVLLMLSPLALGATLGATFPLAAGRAPTTDRGWVVLLGLLFLGAGLAMRLRLPELAVGVLLGLAVAFSAGGRLLAKVVGATERPAMHLLAVLVGVRLQLGEAAVAVAGLALALRVVGKIGAGPLLRPLGARSSAAGLGLLGYSGVALAGAAQLDLLSAGELGPWLLGAAALQSVVADLLGPLGVRAFLRSAGELRVEEAPKGTR